MFSKKYFKDISEISSNLETNKVDALAKSLKKIRDQKGRIFFLIKLLTTTPSLSKKTALFKFATILYYLSLAMDGKLDNARR